MLFFKFIFGQFPPPIKNNLLDKSSKSNITKLSNSIVKITTFSMEHNYMSYNANIQIQLSTFIIFTFTEMNKKTLFMLLCMVSLVTSGFTQQRPCSEYNPCLLGGLCKGGFCVPFGAPQCSKNEQCPAGKICSNAQCITSCALVRCKSGWTCYEGICYENNGNYCQSDNQCGGGFNSCRSNKCCYDPNNNHPKPVPVPQPQPSRPCNQYTNCGINGQCIRGQCVLLYCSTNSQCGRYAKCKNGRCEQITSTPPQTYTYPNPYSWQFFPQPNPRPIIYPVPVPPNTYPNPNYPSYPQHKPHGNHYGNPYGNIASYGGYQGYGNHHRNEQKSEEHKGGSSLPSKCHNNGCGNNQQCLGGICQTSVYGNVCSTNAQCPQSQVCVGNYCRELLCYSNGDCYGHKCISGKCCH